MNFSPILNGYQAFTDGGIPLSGGLIYTYQAGTTTPQTTYFDSNGSVAHSNPIVLGSDGRPPGEIWLSESAAYKFSLFDSLLNPIDEWDNIRGIQILSSSNWIPTGLTPIFFNASQFIIATGNYVSLFPVGIRIQYFLTGTPFYGSVTASSFGGGQTLVTVDVDSTPLNSGLDAVSVSALSPVNTSIPVVFNEDIRFNADVTVAGDTAVAGISVGNANIANVAVLDWYLEQINFTPTWFGTTVPGATVYTVQKGVGTRIGNLFFFQVELSVTSSTGTGTAQIGGFPYTPDTSISAIMAPIRSNTTLVLAGIATTSTSFSITRADTAAGFVASAAVNNTFIMTGHFPIQ